LASGEAITLDLDAAGSLAIAVNGAVSANTTEKEDAILNTGTITANGGKVILNARALQDVFVNAVNNTGVIEARTMNDLDGNPVEGSVEIDASGDARLGLIEADDVDVDVSGSVVDGHVKGKRVNLSAGLDMGDYDYSYTYDWAFPCVFVEVDDFARIHAGRNFAVSLTHNAGHDLVLGDKTYADIGFGNGDSVCFEYLSGGLTVDRNYWDELDMRFLFLTSAGDMNVLVSLGADNLSMEARTSIDNHGHFEYHILNLGGESYNADALYLFAKNAEFLLNSFSPFFAENAQYGKVCFITENDVFNVRRLPRAGYVILENSTGDIVIDQNISMSTYGKLTMGAKNIRTINDAVVTARFLQVESDGEVDVATRAMDGYMMLGTCPSNFAGQGAMMQELKVDHDGDLYLANVSDVERLDVTATGNIDGYDHDKYIPTGEAYAELEYSSDSYPVMCNLFDVSLSSLHGSIGVRKQLRLPIGSLRLYAPEGTVGSADKAGVVWLIDFSRSINTSNFYVLEYGNASMSVEYQEPLEFILSLSGGNISGNGEDVHLISGGDMLLGNLIDAGHKDAYLTAGGDMLKVSDDSNVIAFNVILAADGKLGEAQNPLNLTYTGKLTENKDPFAPENADSFSHDVDVWSKDNTVGVDWSAVTDDNSFPSSGVAGYQFCWSTSPDTVPDTQVVNDTSSSTALDDGATWYFHVRSVDNSGNISDTIHLGPFKIDTVAPEVTMTRTPANSNGWNNTDVTATFEASDEMSGLTSEAEIVHVFTEDGADQFATYAFQDEAGNITTATVDNVNIDTVAPELNVTRSREKNEYGWDNEDVTYTYEGFDVLSDVDVATSDLAVDTITSEGRDQSVDAIVCDAAGNCRSYADTVNLDKTAPVIEAVRDTAANEYGWNNTDVGVSFRASDEESGLVTAAAGGVSFTDEGRNQAVTFFAEDEAGNISTTTVDGINIDKQAPLDLSPGMPAALSPNGGVFFYHSPDAIDDSAIQRLMTDIDMYEFIDGVVKRPVKSSAR
jgi:hypothetical protein